jgi:hypothetical protein
MDDMVAIVPREDAARIVRAGRALMIVGWATILLIAYFVRSEMIQPGRQFLIFVPLGILLAASYFLLSSRCPRCHREFFAEKSGLGAMFGRFRCVACGYDPAARDDVAPVPGARL